MFSPIFSLKWTKKSSPLLENQVQHSAADNMDIESLVHKLDSDISNYKEAILGYIGGFFVRKMLPNLSCTVCAEALTAQTMSHAAIPWCLSLIFIKNRGELISPSTDVMKILRVCEMVFKGYLSGSDFRNPKISSDKNIKLCMQNRILYELSTENLFSCLNAHDYDHDPGTDALVTVDIEHRYQILWKIL